MREAAQGQVSDLTKLEGDPTDRAVVHLQQENLDFQVKMPGTFIKMKAKIHPDSPQSTACTTLVLVAAGCLVTGVTAGIGAPVVAALIAGASMPVGIFTLVRVVSRWIKLGARHFAVRGRSADGSTDRA